MTNLIFTTTQVGNFTGSELPGTLVRNSINTILSTFAKYGFASSPLTRKHIALLIIRGFDADSIYSIGCDVNAGIYSTKY